MPIENEIKYVLDMDNEDINAVYASEIVTISQGYIDGNRIRKTDSFGKQEYHFCYKRRTKNGENIELEYEMTKTDFDLLWEDCLETLTKTRITLPDKFDDEHWVIDFFQGDNGVYFAMAECEMLPGHRSPYSIPEIIQGKVLFKVPRDDDRFTSKKLCDVKYAKSLLNDLRS